MALSAFTTELTGITEEHMKNAKSFADSIDEILDFIGDSILVAHNATFDYNFQTMSWQESDVPQS